jgi:hypothetical protein
MDVGWQAHVPPPLPLLAPLDHGELCLSALWRRAPQVHRRPVCAVRVAGGAVHAAAALRLQHGP